MILCALGFSKPSYGAPHRHYEAALFVIISLVKKVVEPQYRPSRIEDELHQGAAILVVHTMSKPEIFIIKCFRLEHGDVE